MARLFTEKIALLNKKEAEGNAEFEEIMREVQATKRQKAAVCGSNNNNNSNGSRLFVSDSQEIEEVYKDMVQCVGLQFREQEEKSGSSPPVQFEDYQQQQQQQGSNSLHNNVQSGEWQKSSSDPALHIVVANEGNLSTVTDDNQMIEENGLIVEPMLIESHAIIDTIPNIDIITIEDEVLVGFEMITPPQLKVNDLISDSDCGLTVDSYNNRQVSLSDACNSNNNYNNNSGIGIMRSKNHNSIDYLNKQQHHHLHYQRANLTPDGNFQFNYSESDILNYQPGNLSNHNHDQNQQPFNYHSLGEIQRCDETRFGDDGQFQITTNGQVSNYLSNNKRFCHSNRSSKYSIGAQHGSVSPLQDSSSNLTSPQSKQNSPESVPNEYLPYPHFSSARSFATPPEVDIITSQPRRSGFTIREILEIN